MLQALHPGFSDAWRSPPTLSSILTQGYFFFECLGIQFFNSLTCELRDAMSRQRSLTLLPEEAEDFPRSSSHSNHMSPLTYLVWLQTICYNSRLVFIEINTAKAFTCCENCDKKYRAAAKLISNHKLQNNCSLKKGISKRKCFLKLLPQIIHFTTQMHIKIAPSKNTFQNIVAWCLVTYNILKGDFFYLLEN